MDGEILKNQERDLRVEIHVDLEEGRPRRCQVGNRGEGLELKMKILERARGFEPLTTSLGS
jgi:hypothetical protein